MIATTVLDAPLAAFTAVFREEIVGSENGRVVPKVAIVAEILIGRTLHADQKTQRFYGDAVAGPYAGCARPLESFASNRHGSPTQNSDAPSGRHAGNAQRLLLESAQLEVQQLRA